MKKIAKPDLTKASHQPQSHNKGKKANRIHLEVITEKERELYRVPSYGYIL